MAKLKNWPFTSNLAIRLFWPFVGPDRIYSIHPYSNRETIRWEINADGHVTKSFIFDIEYNA